MTRLAYILSASHSGSTLLSMLLGAHSQIATIGEMKLAAGAMGDLHQYRCSCGRLIQECGFWQRIEEGMAARGVEFALANAGTDYRTARSSYVRRLLAPMHKGRILEAIRDAALNLAPAWREHLVRTHKRNAVLAATVSEIAKAQVIIDSSKVGIRLKYLLRNGELDVKVIRLIRDGRAVALTYMDPAGFADAKDPTRRAGGLGGEREKERLTMTQAAYEWRRSMEEAEHILRTLDPSRWIEIRYEDYCRESDAALSRLHEFLGVDPGRQPRRFRDVEQHVVGNGMRLDTTSEIRLDERWKEHLTKADLHLFDQIAGRMNRHYGYV
jgi:hypothetical protein